MMSVTHQKSSIQHPEFARELRRVRGQRMTYCSLQRQRCERQPKPVPRVNIFRASFVCQTVQFDDGGGETKAHQRDDNQPVVNPEPVPLEPAAQYPQRNRNHGQDPRRNRRGNNDGAPVLGEVEAWRWWWQPTSHTYRYERHKGAATA